MAVLFGSSSSALLLAGVYQLSLARIAADDYATASDSPAYPGSLDEPAGRLCNWKTMLGGLCLSSGKPSYQDQGTTGYRTVAAEIPMEFPGNDRAIQRRGSCAGPGTPTAACCVWHL